MSRREWNKTARIVEEAREIPSAEYPMTLRQCFYRLVSREVIQNSRRDYQMLSRILTKVRNDGRVDFDWLVDRSRPVYAPCLFENPQWYGSPIAARIVVCRHCYASLTICRRYPCSWLPGRKEPIATPLIWTAETGVNTRILKRLQTAAARKIAKESK